MILVAFCAVDKDNIEYYFISSSIEHKYADTYENEYYLEDNFSYIDNYSEAKISNKKELYDSIYYIINSGSDFVERYCDIEYKECINDLDILAKDNDTLSVFNNYVHPYNTFETLEVSHDDRTFSIRVNHTYTKDEIEKIDSKIDEIIKEKITNNMTPREKIKILHDYIIDNTDYDTYKMDNIDDDTYSSNTAYGVFFENKGICSGYSDAMAIFLDKLNIINYKISTDEHIWNLVFVDGKWYHLDLTWDDPVSEKNMTRDKYFLITTDNLKYINDGDHEYNNMYYKEA